ncbi:hypothetical protein KOW79_011002 [Hemibagrus wyckioides]|uniref:Uncharacterized protein n=1 Tax=Hemibagrus wyckioides TaxID=337641 RepID=A0A9D3SJ73_9TELE|nr:hypothetical protein KOW79_011002 [Hemibagrus wyckioides]
MRSCSRTAIAELLSSILMEDDVEPGAIVLSAYFGTLLGALFCCTVKVNETLIVRSTVYISQGFYRCTDFVHWHYTCAVDMINGLLEEIPARGYLLAWSEDVPATPSQCLATRIVEEMRGMIRTLEGGWWGFSTGNSRWLLHRDVVYDLNKMTAEYQNPIAAICYVNEEEHSDYLFEIATAHLSTTYKVRFCGMGFMLKSNIFSTLSDMLQHISTEKGVTFVTRPSPKLQELCRDSLRMHPEELECVPIPGRLTRCYKFIQGAYSNPKDLIGELLEEIRDGILLDRPDEAPYLTTGFYSGTNVLSEMKILLKHLGCKWSGHKSPLDKDYLIKDLQKLHELFGHENSADIFCYTRQARNGTGHLFDVLTWTGGEYQVSFHTSGFQLHGQGKVHFASLRDLVKYMVHDTTLTLTVTR